MPISRFTWSRVVGEGASGLVGVRLSGRLRRLHSRSIRGARRQCGRRLATARWGCPCRCSRWVPWCGIHGHCGRARQARVGSDQVRRGDSPVGDLGGKPRFVRSARTRASFSAREPRRLGGAGSRTRPVRAVRVRHERRAEVEETQDRSRFRLRLAGCKAMATRGQAIACSSDLFLETSS